MEAISAKIKIESAGILWHAKDIVKRFEACAMETKQLTKIIKRNHHWLNLRGIYIDIMPVETAQNILENPRLDPNHHHDKDDS